MFCRTQSRDIPEETPGLAQVGAFGKLVILEEFVLRFEELPGASALRRDNTQLQGLH